MADIPIPPDSPTLDQFSRSLGIRPNPIPNGIPSPGPNIATPVDNVQDRLTQLLLNPPVRKDPSRFQRIMAGIGGIAAGLGGPQAALATRHAMLDNGYQQALANWQNQINTIEPAYRTMMSAKTGEDKLQVSNQRSQLSNELAQAKLEEQKREADAKEEDRKKQLEDLNKRVEGYRQNIDSIVQARTSRDEQHKAELAQKDQQFNKRLAAETKWKDAQHQAAMYRATHPSETSQVYHQQQDNLDRESAKAWFARAQAAGMDADAMKGDSIKLPPGESRYAQILLGGGDIDKPQVSYNPTGKVQPLTKPSTAHDRDLQTALKTSNSLLKNIRGQLDEGYKGGPISGRLIEAGGKIGIAGMQNQRLMSDLNNLIALEASTLSGGRGVYSLLKSLQDKSGNFRMDRSSLEGALKSVEDLINARRQGINKSPSGQGPTTVPKPKFSIGQGQPIPKE